jgi:hypothetical protein
MERRIGEIFEIDCVSLEVVEHTGCSCKGCYFNYLACEMFWNTRGSCGPRRTDKKSVIFKKVDGTRKLLTKAHEELVRYGIESEIVDEIEEYLNKTK